MLHRSGMLGLLRYDRETNGKEPERQKEHRLEHAELKTSLQQTLVKFRARQMTANSLSFERSEESLTFVCARCNCREPIARDVSLAQHDRAVKRLPRFTDLT